MKSEDFSALATLRSLAHDALAGLHAVLTQGPMREFGGLVGSTMGGMSMVIELPDEMVRRLEPVAASRGETIEEAALEALDVSPLLIERVVSAEVPRRRRLAFIGSGSSVDARPTDIHRLRREIADQRTV